MAQRPSARGVKETIIPFGEALVLAERRRLEGRLAEAEALCRGALESDSHRGQAEHLLGLIAHQNGKLGEAIEHLKLATKSAPDVALFHANLGEMLRLSGRPKLAVEAAKRALEIDPHMAVALSNLGAALYDLHDYEEAARADRKAIQAKPDFAEAYNSLGNALHGLRRFDESVVAYRRAVELNPRLADAWGNLGNALHHSGEFEEAMAALRHGVALAPEHANARSGLGILLLMRGDFGEGWDEYEWRLRSSERTGPLFPERPWQGESLAGKHIYVQAEQGFGDTLQFVRYIPLLAQRAGKVSLRVHQELADLLRDNLPGIDVLGDRGSVAPYDCDTVLLSLPRLFKTRLETVPAAIPYLRAPAEAVVRWKTRLHASPGLKVGIVWAGNPKHVNDSRRSQKLATLAPIFSVPGVSFFGLQVAPRSADLEKHRGFEITDLSRAVVDFRECAAAMTALDLMITVDTSAAHLSGALGRPTWVLLPWVTDWRYMQDREDCLWYPTLRLYREKRGEGWRPVMARIAKDLESMARGDLAPLTPFKELGEGRAARAAAIIAAQTQQTLTPHAPCTLSPGQALILAEQKRQRGFLADAEALCRQAIAAEPTNAEAVHLLGIVAQQSGKLAEAIARLRQAIALAPNVALYHANLGEMCRLAGQVDEAIATGQHALELDPKHKGALNNVGIACFEKDKFEEAVGYYTRALAVADDFVQAHSNRGNALLRLKRFAEAEVCYRRAIELQPQFPDGWNNLGTCLREMKCPEEAERAYRKALELAPHNPDALDNLALALKDLNRLDEAAETLRRALAIESRSVNIHVHLAMVLLDQKKFDEAGAAVERARALDPNNHDAINMAGRVAFERGELAEALAEFRRALALKPDLADAYNNMGNALKELGQLEEAQAAYLRSVELDPAATGVYVNLADSKKFLHDDPLLTAMEELAAQSGGLSKTDRMQLDFALSKAYADLKEYQRSFTHLLKGCAAKRAMISYDERAVLELFDRIETLFTTSLIEKARGAGDASARPIFILGMPRSGTTLVEQILGSHPSVHGAGELQTLNEVVLSVRGADGNPIPYPEFVPALDADALKAIGSRYVAAVGELASRNGGRRSERVTDKMPSNYYFLGLIHLALPNAKIIHTTRDPLDTCVSCFSKLFSAEQNHTYDLAELGRYYRRYQQLMAHWRKVLPPGAFLDVCYEDVVDDLEGTAKKLVAYCGLRWNERCLAFHVTNRPVRTASATQVRQPIYKSAIGRWRVYEQFLAPLLNALR